MISALFTPCLNSRTLGPLHLVILRYRVKKVGQKKHLLMRYGCPRVKIGKNQSNCTANQETMGNQCYKCYIWLEALAHGLSNAFYCIFFKKKLVRNGKQMKKTTFCIFDVSVVQSEKNSCPAMYWPETPVLYTIHYIYICSTL